MRAIPWAVAGGLALGAATVTLGWAAAGARAAEDGALVASGVGVYDLVQDDDQAIDLRIEYRHGGKLWLFKPWVGLEVTTDGAFYALGGLLADVEIGRNIVFTPSFGIGGYHEGDGKDLGYALQFRTQIELAYRFDNESRLGIALSHISNGSLADKNPGAEVLTVYYALPLGKLGGN